VVEDTGPGVAREDQGEDLPPFFSGAGGAGLGLSLARGIVHRHGGTLRVDGEPGDGAAFVVRLPLWSGDDGG
jgi:signal transduction histidine kinase